MEDMLFYLMKLSPLDKKGLGYGLFIGVLLSLLNVLTSGGAFLLVFLPLLLFIEENPFLNDLKDHFFLSTFNCVDQECKDEMMLVGSLISLIIFPILGLLIGKLFEVIVLPRIEDPTELFTHKKRWVMGAVLGFGFGIVGAIVNFIMAGFLALGLLYPFVMIFMLLSDCGGEECWGVAVFGGSYLFIILTPLAGFLVPFLWDLRKYRKRNDVKEVANDATEVEKPNKKTKKKSKKEKYSSDITYLESNPNLGNRDKLQEEDGINSRKKKRREKKISKFFRDLRNTIEDSHEKITKSLFIIVAVFTIGAVGYYIYVNEYAKEHGYDESQSFCNEFKLESRNLREENVILRKYSHSPYAYYTWEDEELKKKHVEFRWFPITQDYLLSFSPDVGLLEREGPCRSSNTDSATALKMIGGECAALYWLEDRDGNKIDSEEALLEEFAPIESGDEAAALIVAQVDDLSIKQEGSLKVPEGSYASFPDGYFVQLVNKNSYGCSPFEETGVIYFVANDGEFRRVAYVPERELLPDEESYCDY